MTANSTQALKFSGESSALVTYLTANEASVVALQGNIAAGSAATTYLTVRTGAPTTTFITPLVYDDTAVTGGLYAWAGTAYTKIAGLVS